MLATLSQRSLKRVQKSKYATAIGVTGSRFHVYGWVSGHSQRRYTSAAAHGAQNSTSQSSEVNCHDTPWSSKDEVSSSDILRPKTVPSRHHLHLARVTGHGNVSAAFNVCAKMKEEGIPPSLTAYNWLLQSCGAAALPLEARAVFEDMASMGIQFDRTSVHHLLKAHRLAPSRESDIPIILEKMSGRNIEPNATTFSTIIEILLGGENDNDINLERVLQIYLEMLSRKIIPDMNIARRVIILTAQRGFPRLALDLAAAFEESSIRRLDSMVWINCLQSSAEALYADGVLKCWATAVHRMKVTLNEGLCINVLHTAARHGLSALGIEVIHVLTVMGVRLEEYHFAPVLEAFCRSAGIQEAFGALTLMRKNGVLPSPSTCSPLYDKIRLDTDTVDESFAIAEKMRDNGESVDVAVLNVIIQAAISLGDIQRAIGVFSTFPDFNLQPTVDTLNHLLSGCVTARHRELGNKILNDAMKDSKLKPNAGTYKEMILLCLTQDTYEDAFFYLEEMKGKGFFPPLEVYEALVRKCHEAGDVRYRIALEEIKECGYSVSGG